MKDWVYRVEEVNWVQSSVREETVERAKKWLS